MAEARRKPVLGQADDDGDRARRRVEDARRRLDELEGWLRPEERVRPSCDTSPGSRTDFVATEVPALKSRPLGQARDAVQSP